MIPAKEFDGELWIRAADIHLLTKDKKRTWVWLTDEEIEQMGLSNYIKVVRETEAKLKELNT